MTVVAGQHGQQQGTSARYLVAVWALLMGITAVSWWIGTSHEPAAMATDAIVLLAFIKAYCVGRSFMELREAATLLHALFAFWCAATAMILIAMATWL